MQLIQFLTIQVNSVIELLSNAIWLLTAEFIQKYLEFSLLLYLRLNYHQRFMVRRC